MKRENLLTILILLGLILGVLVGQYVLFDPDATGASLRVKTELWRTAGDILFIQPLKMMIVPLVFLSVVVGVTSIGNPSRLGVVGGATLVYFLITTLMAVMLGLLIVNLVQPGAGVSPESMAGAAQEDYAKSVQKAVETGPASVGAAFLNLLRDMIPTNIVKAAADTNVLALVIFAMLSGVALAVVGEKARLAVEVLEGLLTAMMKIVLWIMWLAPAGVFFIVGARVGEVGLGRLVGPLGWYILCVIVGLIIHGFLVLPLILWVFGRTNPLRFLWNLRRVILTAFSTSSSSATLPVTIETCRDMGGCSKRAATFVPALGATINMNGTALYEAVAVVFLFQMFGYELNTTQQLIIVITATLAAVGAPGIPSAGLVTMAIVINAVNSSILAVKPDAAPLPLWTIGIIFGVDRFLDMCRTVINVWGDCVGAKIITRLAPDDPEEAIAAKSV